MYGKHALEIVNKCNPRNAKPNIQPRMSANASHCFDHLIGWITFVVLFKFVYLQQHVEDMCIFQRNNATGKCKLLSDCPKAIEDLRSLKLFPQTCGFEGTLPVVCCEDSPSNISLIERDDFPVESKSKQKCKEYSDEYSKGISVTYIPGIDFLVRETCVDSHGLLIEDNTARPKEFPHMAAIGYEGEYNQILWLCSGVLISENFILAAASCFSNRSSGKPKYVRIGDSDLDTDQDDASPQEFNVAGIYTYPNFKPPSVYNDIGLLQLDNPVKFTLYARPACLYTNSTLPSLNPIVTGWGREDDTSVINSHLLKESLKFVSHAECERSFQNTTCAQKLQRRIVDETQVCAGLRGSQKTCMLVTGALLTANTKGDCMYDVVGITSLSRSCGIAKIPDVFTRVSAYIPWIEEIVWPS